MDTQNKVEKTRIPLTPEGEEFQRRVNKLIKHGALKVTKDGTQYALAPTLKAGKPRTEAAKIAGGKLGIGGVLASGATVNGLKSAASMIDIADRHSQSFDGHHVPDGLSAGINAAGVPAYLAAGALNAKKLQVERKTAKFHMAEAANYAAGAHKYMVSGGQGSEDDYLKFCTHTEPVFGKRGHQSSSSLDKQVYGLNIPRYFSNMGAAVSSLVGAVAKFGHVASANLTVTTTFSTTVTTTVATTVAAVATTVTAGVLTLVASGCEAGVAYAQDKKARRELKANKKTSEGFKKWEEGQANATDLDKVTAEAAALERGRRRDTHKRTRANAKVSYAKAIGAAILAVTSLALLFTVSVATAGIAAGVLAGLFAAGCLTYGVVQARRELKAARETKRSQRQARSLMSQYSIEAIRNGMTGGDRCASFVVTTNERKGFFTRERKDHKETVDIRKNGYLSVEIGAYVLAESFCKLEWEVPKVRAAVEAICGAPSGKPESGEQVQLGADEKSGPKIAVKEATEILGAEAVKILSRLKAGGMPADKLRAMCQQGMKKSTDSETPSDSVARRSALMRPYIAGAEKFAWTPEKAPLPTPEPVKASGSTASVDANSAYQVASPIDSASRIQSTISIVSLDSESESEKPAPAPTATKPAESKKSAAPNASGARRRLIPSYSQQASFALKNAKPPKDGTSPRQARLADTNKDVKTPSPTGVPDSPGSSRSGQTSRTLKDSSSGLSAAQLVSLESTTSSLKLDLTLARLKKSPGVLDPNLASPDTPSGAKKSSQ